MTQGGAFMSGINQISISFPSYDHVYNAAGSGGNAKVSGAAGGISDESGRIKLPGQEKKEKEERNEKLGIKDPNAECQTCKNRKYKDGSDEMVSYKSPTHISPENAAAAVRSHEQEHVTNAYTKAAKGNGKVLSATVQIHMGICPECGRSYVEGGTTNTQIKYYNEDNPYQKDLKASDYDKYAGMNADYAV